MKPPTGTFIIPEHITDVSQHQEFISCTLKWEQVYEKDDSDIIRYFFN